MQQKMLSENKSVHKKHNPGAKRWMTRGLAGLLGLIMILSLITPMFALAAESTEDQIPAPQQTGDPSDIQIAASGGSITNDADSVTVSKTINGTDIENVFDITLSVETTHDLQTISVDPDMAVVIVMDISATMTQDIIGGQKYASAMAAAKSFVNKFSAQTSGISKIGYVTFNTDAQQICAMQSCSGDAQAAAFNTNMKNGTDAIINTSGYGSSRHRFTNIEAGLAMARDMLAPLTNKNKFIVFLSDGLPTTYIKSGYTGYNPATGGDDVFYDEINNQKVLYGTNYSDEGAKRAQNVAASIKASGVSIYAVGVGIHSFNGSQLTDGSKYQNLSGNEYIQNQLKRVTMASNVNARAATIDCDCETFEELVIGKTSFETWLKNSIGSGKFYDCNDTDALSAAYDKIFEELTILSIANSADLWTVTDPVPAELELIGLYNKAGDTLSSSLTGSLANNAENTVSVNSGTINWDLKNSGFTYTTEGNETTYKYSVTYRVRLKNEASSFVEEQIYNTNGKTSLTYRTIVSENGHKTYSPVKTMDFLIPSVKGWLGELSFSKVDQFGNTVPGAEFTLSHSADCSVCRGDNTPVTSVANLIAVSDGNGLVSFTGIPSGHIYTLSETKVPAGYTASGETYTVTVAYDAVTVTKDGTAVQLDKIVNEVMTAEIQLQGTKYLTNPNDAAHSYTFEMVQVAGANGDALAGAAAPVEAVATLAAGEGSAAFTFPVLNYTAADLAGEASKTFYYQINEVGADTASVNMDESVYVVEVTLTGNADSLSAAVTNVYQDGAALTGQLNVSFTNTLLGELTITKNLELLDGSSVSEDQTFIIQVKHSDGTPMAEGTPYTVAGEEKTVDAGGFITLKAGETARFQGLTAGETYTVTEAEASAYGYEVIYTPATAVIPEKTDESPAAAIEVTNKELAATVDIEGVKYLANPDGKEHTFEFQLVQVDEKGEVIADGVTEQASVTMTEANAPFRFTLNYKGTDLAGAASRDFYYKVTEITQSDLTVVSDEAEYLVKVTLTSEPNGLKAEVAEISREDAAVTELSFTNTLLGTLTLEKKIVGTASGSPKFTFEIRADLEGSFFATLNNTDTSVVFQDGKASVKLGHQDVLVIYGIPNGTAVTITEAKSEYTVHYTVNGGEKKEGTTANGTVSTDGVKFLFNNYSPYGLPQTGQLNWPVMLLGILGIACVAAGFVVLLKPKGKYEP